MNARKTSPKNFWLIRVCHKLRNNPKNKNTQPKEKKRKFVISANSVFHTLGGRAIDPAPKIHSEHRK